jgi:hypothetical protein
MSLQILFKGPKLAASLLTHAAGCAVCFVSPSLHFCICISQPQDRDGGGFLGAIAARILTFLVVANHAVPSQRTFCRADIYP